MNFQDHALREAAAAATAGALLGGLAGRVARAPVLGAAIGAANGALSGYRGIYDWKNRSGKLAFVLDSTWALPTTAAGTLAGIVNTALSGDFVEELSVRKNRHVFGRGLRVRRRFATTMGNVVTNASADGRYDLREETLEAARRRSLIDIHEELHVWQARWFGPLFPVVYGGWMAAGVVAGFLGWLRHGGSLGKAIETVSYYDNPFEFWAYVADDYWPPQGVHPKLAWRAPKRLRPKIPTAVKQSPSGS